MQPVWETLSQLQIFFQLNFLLTGLELSSAWIFVLRSLVFLTCLIGFVWGLFRIALKILDVFQTLVSALSPLPKSFFLLLLLVIPFPDNSLGGRWIGYILLMLSGTTLAIGAALTVTMWKYGVDQTLRVINFFRSKSQHYEESNPSHQYFTENVKSTL
ncbi:MAG: hypothetical protein NTY51_02625 [Deltaproteobacteria bacterium]|nr:hypothetical protein [Deltaproteobacteria bacterium]